MVVHLSGLVAAGIGVPLLFPDLTQYFVEDVELVVDGQLLSLRQLCFLLLHDLLDVLVDVFLVGLVALCLQLVVLLFLEQVGVPALVHEQLVRMLVVRHEFYIPVDLVGHTPFTAVLDLVGETMGVQWNQVHITEGQSVGLFPLAVPHQVLFAETGQLSVLVVHPQERVVVVSTPQSHCEFSIAGSR